MRVLALDTTTRAGSVAVVENDRVIVERSGDLRRTHAERLPGEILEALGDARSDLSEIEAFAVAAGPGSFTGLRIGIATIQGLAFVRRKRVVAVSALDALAHAARRDLAPGALVGSWIDAYRGEVFSALYRVTDAPPNAPGRLIEVDGAAVGDPQSTLARWAAHAQVDLFVGDGAVRYSEVIGRSGRVAAVPLLAGTIGTIAAARAQAGDTVDPAGIQPLYVRRPDAVLDRERRTFSAPGTSDGKPR
jgi:tRNA threonylcarbamoyladenosine biosynthesis protein TsaB